MQKFEPFQKVIVRNRVVSHWYCDMYSHKGEGTVRPHCVLSGSTYADEDILPYAGNEHLLGTTNSPRPKWEPKTGDLVAARNKNDIWLPAIFCARKMLLTGEEAFTIQWFDRTERLVEEVEPLRKHFTIPEE